MVDSPIFYLAGPASHLYKDVDTPGGILGDAGFNLLMPRDVVVPPTGPGGRAHVVDLEVCGRCAAGGQYCAFQIVFRSSAGRDTPLGLANSIGIIDAGYQGPLKIVLRNYSDTPYTVKKGAAIVQIVRPSLEPARLAVVGEGHPAFSMATARGAGGFGSTGGTTTSCNSAFAAAAPSAFAAAPSAFAAAAPSAFAAAAPSAFAAALAAPFASAETPLFGGRPTPPFASAETPLFGERPTPPFGGRPTPLFGGAPAFSKPSGPTTPLDNFAASAPGLATANHGMFSPPLSTSKNWTHDVDSAVRKGAKGCRGRGAGRK